MTNTAVPQRGGLSLEGLTSEEATALLFAAVPGITYREVAKRLGEEPTVILGRLKSALQALSPVAASRGTCWI